MAVAMANASSILNAKIANDAIHLGMPEKQLACSEVANLPQNWATLERRIECVPYAMVSKLDLPIGRSGVSLYFTAKSSIS